MNSIVNTPKLMKLPEELEIKPKRVCNEIEELIVEIKNKLDREGAVIGLSGGLDSAVAAAITIRALGKENVQLVNMPERDSKRLHRKHAKKLAKHFGIKLKTIRLTPTLKKIGVYKLLPFRFIPTKKLRALAVRLGESRMDSADKEDMLLKRFTSRDNKWFVRGQTYSFTKHRVRMVTLYQFAEIRNLLVVGASNKTEWFTGSYSKWGVDHCADIMPLKHLYRSQLHQLAHFLQLPKFIIEKPADPDVIPGIASKESLLNGFIHTDQILHSLENGYERRDLEDKFGAKAVERVLLLKKYSQHMRESPYQN
jgi:NAD+ synthase